MSASADIAVVSTLLDYYGLPYSVRSLTDYLHHHRYGSLVTELADCLTQHGLITTLINANPLLLSKRLWDQVFLLDYPKTTPDKLPPINELERIIAKGVYVRRQLPTQETIDAELSQERPVVISYNPALIDTLRPHSVSFAILTAGNENAYTMLEPDFEQSTTQQLKQHVLYAISQAGSQDPSVGSIILSKEKRPAPTQPPAPPSDLSTVQFSPPAQPDEDHDTFA